MKYRVPIDEILVKMKVVEDALCYCCTNPQPESIDQVFLLSPIATRVWNTFEAAVGVDTSEVQLKVVMHRWWNVDVCSKVKPIMHTIPTFIIWQLLEKKKYPKAWREDVTLQDCWRD